VRSTSLITSFTTPFAHGSMTTMQPAEALGSPLGLYVAYCATSQNKTRNRQNAQ
jgi:hypothetical protein